MIEELIKNIFSLVSQNIQVLSSPPEAIILLSGLKIAVLTQFK
jgi:hypothetical protein